MYADFYHEDLQTKLKVKMQKRGEEVRLKAVENSNGGKVEKRTVSYMLGIGVAACVPRSKIYNNANDEK